MRDSDLRENTVSAGSYDTDQRDVVFEPALTTAADVDSAGRSCMAILVLFGLILLVVVIWLVFRSFGGGG